MYHNTLVLDRMLFSQGLEQSLQIIHIKERAHWSTLHFIQSEIFLYDSLFTSANPDTLELSTTGEAKEKYFQC